MRFAIFRDRWLRGESGTLSSLLREPDGKMCCLGFRLLLAGCEAGDIAGWSSPAQVAKEHPELPVPKALLGGRFEDASEECALLMARNDLPIGVTSATTMKGELQREAEIAAAFASIGDEVEFIDSDRRKGERRGEDIMDGAQWIRLNGGPEFRERRAGLEDRRVLPAIPSFEQLAGALSSYQTRHAKKLGTGSPSLPADSPQGSQG